MVRRVFVREADLAEMREGFGEQVVEIFQLIETSITGLVAELSPSFCFAQPEQ